MRRLGVAAWLVAVIAVVGALPAEALAVAKYPVSGSIAGTSQIVSTSPCVAIRQTVDAGGDVEPFGAATAIHLDFCLESINGTTFIVTSGTFLLGDADGTMFGNMGGSIDTSGPGPNFPYSFRLEPAGGSGPYANAGGSINLDGFFGAGGATINGTASGTLHAGPVLPSRPADCKHAKWKTYTDLHGHAAFAMAHDCNAFVKAQKKLG